MLCLIIFISINLYLTGLGKWIANQMFDGFDFVDELKKQYEYAKEMFQKIS